MNKLESLEKEVRIVAREKRPVHFIDRIINIKGIPFSAIESVGDKIASVLAPFLGTAVQQMNNTESGGGEMVADLDLAKMASVAPGIRDVAKILIETGTDISWEEARDCEWLAVISLAMEVLKFNLGPELRDFLSHEAGEIARVFGIDIRGVRSDTTEPKPSSSEPVTESTKSAE